jgi:hypothetical protein
VVLRKKLAVLLAAAMMLGVMSAVRKKEIFI